MAGVPRGAGATAAVESAADTVFQPVTEIFSTIVFFPITVGGVGFPAVVAWLIAAGVIFTIYFGFIQFHGLKTSHEVIRGHYSSKSDPGEVPHFHALTSALSGTVGLGNIAGVSAPPWPPAAPVRHSG